MIFEHYRELVTAEAAKGWFSVVPKAARFKVRSTKAGNRQKPKTEPENVTVMPDALAA